VNIGEGLINGDLSKFEIVINNQSEHDVTFLPNTAVGETIDCDYQDVGLDVNTVEIASEIFNKDDPIGRIKTGKRIGESS